MADLLAREMRIQTTSVAVGHAFYVARNKEKFTDVIHRADSEMYRAKAQMKLTL